MKLRASSGGGNFERPKPGNYTGVLVGFFDIGTQPSSNPAFKPQRRCVLLWELHRRKGPVFGQDNRILQTQAMYSLSLNEKSRLRPVACAFEGRVLKDTDEVDLKAWLGRAVKLNLTQEDGSEYVNVSGVTALDPEEDSAPEPITPRNEWEFWTIDKIKADPDANIPAIVAKRVEKSEEYRDAKSPTAAYGKPQGRPAPVTAGGGGDDDDIPF